MSPSEFRAAKAPRAELFHGMSERDVDEILRAARPVRVKSGTVLFNAGDRAEYFYLLWKGRGRYFHETENGRKLITIWRIPGHTVGGSAITPRSGSSYLLSEEVVQDSVLLAWDRNTIRALAKRFPLLFENAISIAVNEFAAWYIAAHSCLAAHTAQERLAHVLVELGPVIGNKVDDGIELDVTNEELSECVVLTQFTVSRIMAVWEKIRAVSKRRGKVVIHSNEKLFVAIPSLKAIRLTEKG